MRAGEESGGSRAGQREELNLGEVSAKLSSSPTGSSEAEMALLSSPILRQNGRVLSPHIYSLMQAAPKKVV